MAKPTRSADSLRFEKVVLAALHGDIPRLADIDFSPTQELMPSVALLHPDRDQFTLKFVHAGTMISQLLGREAVGCDYLDIVDQAIKGDAFDATLLMLEKALGLWQLTPGLTESGQRVMAEYTGFPVLDVENKRGLIAMLARLPLGSGRIRVVERSTEYDWLELRPAALN